MGALSADGTARLIMRFGSERVLLAGGVLVALALLLLVRTPVNSDYIRDLLLPMVFMGVGGGLAFPALAMLAMADVGPDDSGLASGLLNTSAQVGGALGLALLATVSTSHTESLLAAGQTTLTAALSAGYHLGWAVGSAFVIVALGMSTMLLVRRRSMGMQAPSDEMEASA